MVYIYQLQKHINAKSKKYICYQLEKNPEYASFVHYKLKQLIASQKELEINEKEQFITAEVDKLLENGVKIDTAYDENVQDIADNAFYHELNPLDVERALVIINHKNYTISAIVGKKNVGMFEFNRTYQGICQPGSSIKPLLVYTPYIDVYHKTPYDLVDTDYVCYGDYCPKNYDGGSYGMVTLKAAMTYSYNTSAVRLLNETGLDTAFSYIKNFK